MYRWLVRPLLFALSPTAAHAAGALALAPIEHLAALRALIGALLAPRDARLVVETMGLRFPSPVGLAGGFDKNAQRPFALSAIGFGFLELGTVTAEAQAPNPAPNLFRLPADRALINRLGFPNEGAKAVVARLRQRLGSYGQDVPPGALGRVFGVPVGLSIGKSRSVEMDPLEPAIADYLASFRLARTVADFVVVNVSSPNTKNLRALQGPEVARRLLEALQAENAAGRRVPLLLKIAPDLANADLDGLLDVVEAVGLDGVIATNTTLRRDGLATTRDEIEAIGAGGLSGPPLRTRALEVVRRVRTRLGPKATVIGVGGIETGADALAFLEAGANLVQLYTGFIYGGPLTARRIAQWLVGHVERVGAKSVGDLALVDG